jgi:hypothetical protein
MYLSVTRGIFRPFEIKDKQRRDTNIYKHTLQSITRNKTLDIRNPPPLTVRCALRGVAATLFTFKIKEEKYDEK